MVAKSKSEWKIHSDIPIMKSVYQSALKIDYDYYIRLSKSVLIFLILGYLLG